MPRFERFTTDRIDGTWFHASGSGRIHRHASDSAKLNIFRPSGRVRFGDVQRREVFNGFPARSGGDRRREQTPKDPHEKHRHSRPLFGAMVKAGINLPVGEAVHVST
jgi:hypothetical protein